MNFEMTAHQVGYLYQRWRDADEIRISLIILTLFTIAVILIRHYLITLTALVAAGSWYEYGPWAMLLSAVVPSTYATAYMALTMRGAGMSSVWLTARNLLKAHKLRKRWPHVAYQLKLTGRGDAEVPRMVNVLPSARGVTADIITGNVAMDASDLIKLERKFASAFFCDRVTIRSESPSMAHVSWEWGHHLRKIIRMWEVPAVEQVPGKPAIAPFGIKDSGEAASIVSNLSTLVGGLSGAGKSSTIWAMIDALASVAPIRLRVVDPSGVEFSAAREQLGQGLVHDYLSDPNRPGTRQFDEFWGDLEEDFNRRMESVEKSGVRRHVPTKAEPLDVLVIDEILPIASQLKKDPTSHIVGRILFLGRKAGFMCIAASQLAQVDVMGRIRDLFPQRICHRTESRYLTDAFLGDGAELDGARCSHLDLVRDVGVFYMSEMGVSGYTACRAAWVSDADVQRISRGLRPVPTEASDLEGKPTSLYAMYGLMGELLYVGIAESSRLETRWREHARTKDWWPEVADMREIDCFPDRLLALTAEAMMIEKRNPKYNIQHNTSKVSK